MAVRVELGAGVQYTLLVGTFYGISDHGRSWVVLAGNYHGHRSIVGPSQGGEVRELPRCRSHQQASQRRLQPTQHDLRLRVAEPRIELDDANTVRRDRQTRIEQAAERRTAMSHLFDRRLENVLEDILDQTGRCPRQR